QDHIKQFLCEQIKRKNIPPHKIPFEIKDIGMYTPCFLAQICDNFKILTDYEYLQLLISKNGTSKVYKLYGGYSASDFLKIILSPEKLKERLEQKELIKTT
ncbi:MAG TPA: hypothetical protein VE912_18530, partial [Bacteroidales bacterium]|nr:hypothetical protein [Bacteroidales bacterium]